MIEVQFHLDSCVAYMLILRAWPAYHKLFIIRIFQGVTTHHARTRTNGARLRASAALRHRQLHSGNTSRLGAATSAREEERHFRESGKDIRFSQSDVLGQDRKMRQFTLPTWKLFSDARKQIHGFSQ